MKPLRVLRTFVGTNDEAIERGERYRSEAEARGVVPDDWDGSVSLKRCHLCRAYNGAAFSVCRICAERLPESTVTPEELRRASVGRSHY